MSQTQKLQSSAPPRPTAPSRPRAPSHPAPPSRPPPPRVVSAVLPGHIPTGSLQQANPNNSRRYTALPHPKVPAQRPTSASVVY